MSPKKRALNNPLDSFRKWVQIKDWIVHLNLYLFDIKKNENSINMNKQSKQEDLSCYIKVSTDRKSKGSKLPQPQKTWSAFLLSTLKERSNVFKHATFGDLRMTLS